MIETTKEMRTMTGETFLAWAKADEASKALELEANYLEEMGGSEGEVADLMEASEEAAMAADAAFVFDGPMMTVTVAAEVARIPKLETDFDFELAHWTHEEAHSATIARILDTLEPTTRPTEATQGRRQYGPQ